MKLFDPINSVDPNEIVGGRDVLFTEETILEDYTFLWYCGKHDKSHE